MNLTGLIQLFANVGCTKLYAKPLAENDNSKNQVYFGPDFEALNLFPNTGIVADSSKKNAIFKAKLNFGWLLPNGQVASSPCAQLILYPQYPEVRFSGFLQGCSAPPSDLMARRLPGRILFIGVSSQQRVIGFVVDSGSEIAGEFLRRNFDSTAGVFIEVALPMAPSGLDSKRALLAELGRIHRLGWIDSKQLDSDGTLKPCNAPQCGGFTLEAELGIAKNSSSEPDYLGWEVKQHTVTNFERIESASPITLMTPEPNGGFYKEHGPEAFVRKFGYPDKKGREDRLNFGGIHYVQQACLATGLTLKVTGFDQSKGKIINADGEIALVSSTGDIAASWSFSKILEHWSRKHAKAVYVPSKRQTMTLRQYAYGNKVRLAEQTDSLRLLKAFTNQSVYYDPGIKLENASSTKPSSKKRSQFRISSQKISALYESVETVYV